MDLFYHHVGQQGASEDFPKTVFDRIPIEVVESNIPIIIPARDEIVRELKKSFPTGTFNCWGVPAGAQSVIKNLKVGDAVLLIETTAGPGYIPVLGIVKAYWNIELRDLSKALWGNHKFPYVFFFETEQIEYTFLEFLDDVGYKPNFRPSGQFYRLSPDRIATLGGAEKFVDQLRKIHAIIGNELKQIEQLTANNYAQAFSEIREQLNDSDIEMLMAHYRAPNHDITADQLAESVGFTRFESANLRYGLLADKLLKHFEIELEEYIKLNVLAGMKNISGKWHWTLRPQVVQALTQLGWFGDDQELSVYSKLDFEELLDEFLDRWPLKAVENMTLQEYVGVGNKDTFCQWVETKTRMLGSIKGQTSFKFGIYERKDPTKMPKIYPYDDKYSWLKKYGNTRDEVFENVKKDIVEIIRLSEKGHFEKIDNIYLPDLYKWKIAFLYSNERLIPIYKRDVLLLIAEHFGLQTNGQTKISKIQEVMISNKPSDKSVYEFMHELYYRFGKDNEKNIINGKPENGKRSKYIKRKGTTKRDTNTYRRTVSRSYIVEQKHNKIQEALQRELEIKYGHENVILEENYVDVKLIQPDYIVFYEVKSNSYASECIKEALGQILFYSYHDQDKRKKKIIVVGQYPANEQDYGYIKYIKEKLKIDFEYINVDIN